MEGKPFVLKVPKVDDQTLKTIVLMENTDQAEAIDSLQEDQVVNKLMWLLDNAPEDAFVKTIYEIRGMLKSSLRALVNRAKEETKSESR